MSRGDNCSHLGPAVAMANSRTSRHGALVLDYNSSHGPLQQAVAAQLNKTLSTLVISMNKRRFCATSKNLIDLGLGFRQLLPPAITDPAVERAINRTRARYKSDLERQLTSVWVQPSRTSTMLSQLASVEGCDTDWLLLFEDDIAMSSALAGDFQKALLNMLRTLEHDPRFKGVPVVQLGVAPPYHRSEASSNHISGLSLSFRLGHQSTVFHSCFGIGMQSLLYRCSLAKHVWHRARAQEEHPPNDVMLRHYFSTLQNASDWAMCPMKSSSWFRQDRAQFKTSLGWNSSQLKDSAGGNKWVEHLRAGVSHVSSSRGRVTSST